MTDPWIQKESEEFAERCVAPLRRGANYVTAGLWVLTLIAFVAWLNIHLQTWRVSPYQLPAELDRLEQRIEALEKQHGFGRRDLRSVDPKAVTH